MEDVSDELTLASTASPSPLPPPKQQYSGAQHEHQRLSSSFRMKSLATLTAPLDAESAARAARMRSSRRRNLSTVLDAGGVRGLGLEGSGGVEEEKQPIPDKRTLEMWARYGFVDSDLLFLATGQAQERAASAGLARSGQELGGGTTRPLVIFEAATDDAWRQAELEHESRERNRRITSASPAAATERESSREGAGRARSLGVGTRNPLTDIMKPSSEEHRRKSGATAANAAVGVGDLPATAAGATRNRGRTAATSSRKGGLDSMAASLLALSAAGAAAAAAQQRAAREEQETKEEELAALKEQETSERAAQAEANHSKTTPKTVAEIERHKRNRAERLRAYGCQRSLYPRIVPGGTDGSGSGNASTPESETEEMETQEWVNTLRGSAALRGESLMAACTQHFAEKKAAELLGDKQSEARASRTADVSGMDGPDGLLHCAVLRGDHALGARAAQFLVDKRGSNVNSTDQWGRTPLHTAAGKGMVDMARFFIRRGANVDALDHDDRSPLFFACAGGNATMARYLTRIEVGARYDLRDKRGHLAGEYFWESVETEARDEIVAILVAAGWPDPPPPANRSRSRRRASAGGEDKHRRSNSLPSPRKSSSSNGQGGQGPKQRHSEGGEAGMKRLASDVMLLIKRR